MRGAFLVFMFAGVTVHAAGVYRCVDETGRLLYSNLRCPASHSESRPTLVLNSWEWEPVKVRKETPADPAPGQKEDTASGYNPVPMTGYRGNPVPFSAPDSNVVRSPRYSVVGGR